MLEIESANIFDKNTGEVLIDDLAVNDLQEENCGCSQDNLKHFERPFEHCEYQISNQKCVKCGQPMYRFYLEGGFQIEGVGIDCQVEKAYICENCWLLEPIFNSDLGFNLVADTEIKNAVIVGAELYINSYGILTFDIEVQDSSDRFHIGGYALDRHIENDDDQGEKTISTPAGLDCMRRIMEVLDATHWSELVGKYIRYEYNGPFSHVTKIGNIISDNWIDIQDFFKNYDYNYWIEQCKVIELKTNCTNG